MFASGCSSTSGSKSDAFFPSLKTVEQLRAEAASHRYEKCVERYKVAFVECDYFLRYETDYLEKDILMKKCLSNNGFPYAKDTCEKLLYSNGDN